VHCRPLYKCRAQRQLVRGQAHCLLGIGNTHPFHLEQNLARLHHRYPVIRRSFAFSHTGFSRFLGDRLVGEKANPHFAAALYETRDGDTAGFDLAVGDLAGLQNFEPILTKRKL